VTTDQEFTGYAGARWRHLVHAAILLGCSPDEAEDLAQATLLRCYTKWSKVAAAAHRDAYVSKVLLNAFRASRRRRWWRERPAADLPDHGVADETARIDGVDAVERALGRLTQDHRAVVVLRFYSHLTEQQIAEALGIAPGTVKSRLSRALDRLSTDTDLADLDGGRRS
jgi:RNA polymerase sigma-70 factor (sigma-E family)